MSDIGLTHVALPVTNMEASLSFYATYAQMQIVHRRTDPNGTEVVWLSDRTRPFVIVLIGMPTVDTPLLPFAHLGVGCETREEVDRLCKQAKQDGCLRGGLQVPTFDTAFSSRSFDPMMGAVYSCKEDAVRLVLGLTVSF